MLQLIKDRRGGTLEKALIWAFLLGGFYFAWTKYLGPKFMSVSNKQAGTLENAADTYFGDSVPTGNETSNNNVIP